MGDGAYDLYVMRADGAEARRLTHGLNAAHPSWSPNGSELAFDTSGTGSIDTIRTDGTELEQLTAGSEDSSPSWSPDGSLIAFARQGGGQAGLWVVSPDTRDSHEIVDASVVGGTVSEPAWSPDGTQIAFVVEGSPSRSTIWVVNVAGGAPLLVSPNAGSNWNPQWISRGSQIAFLHAAAGNTDLDAVGATGSDLHRLLAAFPGQQFSLFERDNAAPSTP
jgi:Tol biopolymer transport system component